ncbi:MAG: PAS domain S-box protein, partial [Desulfuromonadaceae bacterium]|nr:PAS domain S-box protein [Desulfuromonadaceae bacterium]
KHLGNVFTGQLFLAPPDEDYFINQAHQYGFDEKEYLAAMRRVPFYTEEELLKKLTFIHKLTKMLADQGLQYKRLSETEEALKRSEEFTRRIIASSNDGIKILDIGGHILSLSEGGQRLLEIDDVTTYLGVSWIDLWKLDSDGARKAVAAAANGEVATFQGYCPTVKGTPKWWEVIISPIMGADNQIENLLAVSRDITVRRQAEEELRKSIEQIRVFFESPLVGMAITSPENDWLQINDKLCQMLGYTREELKTKSWVDLTYPDDLAPEHEKFDLLMSGKIDNYSIEKRIIRKDGAVVNTNLSICCVRRADGSIDYILGLLEDITAYQLMGRKREEDQRFLQTILDSISDFIFYKDKNGIFLGCNDAYASNYIGLPKDRIIGHPDKDFILNQDLVKKYTESDRQVMESGAPLMLKPWIVYANGKKAQIEVLKSPFYDASGRIAGVIGVARDVTEHQLALEAIIREKETAQRYLDIAGVMFCALNRSGEIILINRKGSEILGYHDNELIGQNWFETCLPEAVRDKVKGVFALQLAGELTPVEFYENSVINKNGEERLIAFHNTLLHDEEGISGVLFSGEDITDKRLTQNELLKNQKLESLGILAGGIAHDFNNILTGIMGNISFARMSLGNQDKVELLLENAEKASLRASSLATQLLTFARGGEPIKKRITVTHILEETLSLALRGTNVKGVVTIPEPLHVIEADEGQLSQVFNNLVINAVQAMPKGGSLVVRAENVLLPPQNKMLLPHGKYVLMSFSDQGCGIAEEDLKKIFDPYFTTKSGGNGLGLASANSIIRRHYGNIGVTSVPGEGTTFQIYLPASDETYSSHQTNCAVQKPGPHVGGSVLVMDDENMILDLLSEMLQHLGYQVSTCENGAEAIAAYKANIKSGKPFSAVIMDLTIPGGMGGKEAAEQILAIDPGARLIVSSGYSNDLVMSNHGSYGFVGAITKPYNIEKISQILSSVT